MGFVEVVTVTAPGHQPIIIARPVHYGARLRFAASAANDKVTLTTTPSPCAGHNTGRIVEVLFVCVKHIDMVMEPPPPSARCFWLGTFFFVCL